MAYFVSIACILLAFVCAILIYKLFRSNDKTIEVRVKDKLGQGVSLWVLAASVFVLWPVADSLLLMLGAPIGIEPLLRSILPLVIVFFGFYFVWDVGVEMFGASDVRSPMQVLKSYIDLGKWAWATVGLGLAGVSLILTALRIWP